MQNAIISDTSCIILLDRTGELDILHAMFGKIITTPEVAAEFGKPLPSWFDIHQTADKDNQAVLEATVDKGEASAIALAIEYGNVLLIIDDLKGRKLAQQLGISIIGTVGIIVNAKLTGIVSSVKPLLAKIKQTNFRISAQLEQAILDKAGE